MAEVIGQYDMEGLKIFLPNRKTPVGGTLYRVKDKGIESKEREYIELVDCGRDAASCPALERLRKSACDAIVFQRKGMESEEIRVPKACGQRLTRKAIHLIMPDEIPVRNLNDDLLDRG